MGESHGYARDAYLGTIGIHIGCTSALLREPLSTCRSHTPILGSGHVWLYPLNIVPTHSHRALGFAAGGSAHEEFCSCMYHGRTI